MELFNFNPLYLADGYKLGHKLMLAENSNRLYGTAIPRKIKYMPKGIDKITVAGNHFVWSIIHDLFQKNFFDKSWGDSGGEAFILDVVNYLGLPYVGDHFKKLHALGYLPMTVQALEDGEETGPNIPHQTFLCDDGFAWLTLYLETLVSMLAWKMPTSATLAREHLKVSYQGLMKTNPEAIDALPYLCHDFSARGLDIFNIISSGLGHAFSFRGSDTLAVIPASRTYFGIKPDEMPVESINASEHSVSTTNIFTVGELGMLQSWLKKFPTGKLGVVIDTFNAWDFITKLVKECKQQILDRDGQVIFRPDSGYPPDIITGLSSVGVDLSIFEKKSLASLVKLALAEDYRAFKRGNEYYKIVDGEAVAISVEEWKGVVELLDDIFGHSISSTEYKILNPKVGVVYGDAINLDRQKEIYSRLESKGYATTNVVLGIGSFTYQYNSRDSLGIAIKGAWFETLDPDTGERVGISIHKDPITDNGTKKSLKGFQFVTKDPKSGEYSCESEVSEEKAYSEANELKVIYQRGQFKGPKPNLNTIRAKIHSSLIKAV